MLSFIDTKYKDLLVELVKREIKARYKQSIFGYLWVIVVPLVHLAVMSIVFSYFVKLPTGGIPYPIFLFVGLVPWTFTANAVTFATSSLTSSVSLITKTKIPREVFPLSSILAKVVDLFLYFLILGAFLLFYNMPIHPTILFLPVIILIHIIFVFGVSMILSAINVFYRDVENILGVLIMAWMYLTPVFYPAELIPAHLTPIFNLNPMMPIINSYRNVIIYGVLPPMQSFLYAAALSLGVFIFGYKFFKNRSKYFADVI